MFKLLISLFLILNSLIGYGFYEDTLFGDYLNELSFAAQLLFVVINFIVSNLIVVWINSPMAFLSLLGLILLLVLIALSLGLWLPYWFVFDLINANDQHMFPWVIYFLITISFLAFLLRPLLAVLLNLLIELNEKFWEGLKTNAINSALDKANKKNKP
jgi:hypothetical protein